MSNKSSFHGEAPAQRNPKIAAAGPIFWWIEKIIAGRVERHQIAPGALGFRGAGKGIGHRAFKCQRRGLLADEHRHVKVAAPTQSPIRG